MIDSIRIDPQAIYDDLALYQALGISADTLGRARRSGELRYTRKGQRILYVGAWLMSWLEKTATLEKPPNSSSSDGKRLLGSGTS